MAPDAFSTFLSEEDAKTKTIFRNAGLYQSKPTGN
jgi:hypothetical protein